jgi:hypothetical protein
MNESAFDREWEIESMAHAIHGGYSHECSSDESSVCRQIARHLYGLGYRDRATRICAEMQRQSVFSDAE